MSNQDECSDENKTRLDDCHSQLFSGDIKIRPKKKKIKMRTECQQGTDTEDLGEEGSRQNIKFKGCKVRMNLGYLRKMEKASIM